MTATLPRRLGLPALAAALTLVASACGTAATPTPTTVNAEVREWGVIPSSTSAPAGTITFAVTNTGPEDVHEFVVIKTDLPAFDLPTDERGVVDEEATGADLEVMDEIEDIAVGATESLTVGLSAGKYVLICNIYDEDEQEAHYKMGMLAGFTVE